MRQLDDNEVAWVREYATQVITEHTAIFDDVQFANPAPLLERLRHTVDALVEHRRSRRFRGIDEAHNELCVASAILSDARCTRLEYEPGLVGCGQTIDFRAELEDMRRVFVDVKTIRPEPRDRWEQFERAKNEHWFPDRVNIALSEDALGGELWHNMFTARSRMLEYAVEFEGKIAACQLEQEANEFVLFLCGMGFHWSEDQLEDFSDYYRRGRHRTDDPFGTVEAHYQEERNIVLKRTISRFACMSRPHGVLRARRINWNVAGPEMFRG